MIIDFVDSLVEILKQPLPGVLAHQTMAPVSRVVKPFDIAEYSDAKVGCVMLLFYPKGDEVHLVLIKRPDYDGTHGGQVSFPGGKSEHGDLDEAFTALRETEEEIGVPRDTIRVLGKLSNVYIPPSNFFVYPFIGYSDSYPNFFPDPQEVAFIIETPIKILLDDGIKSTVKINRPEISFDAPCYLIEGQAVWGATAIILSEMEWLLKKINGAY